LPDPVIGPSDARIGVDIGGTFTDLALETSGGWFTTKILTTPRAPEQAVIEGVRLLLGEAGLRPQDIGLVIHGTTLATNALIERKGARTAFLTTDGFRDTLEIATEGRFEVYDVNLDLPSPLVPRHLRGEIRERIGAQGQVLLPLDEAGVDRFVAKIVRPNRIESVAVGLIHAYANPRHEQRIRELLLARMPGLSVSLSSEVSPEMREYERFSTTCANAYVQPLMGRYLRNLQAQLGQIGLECPLYLMLSGGGLTNVDTAVRFPVRLVESGPAGGAIFAAHIARQLGVAKVISFDMGGTTAKICLIDDYVAQTARLFEVARVYRFKKGSGLPLRIPVIEMVEIGAGGGSIAHIDHLKRIAVGRESAGAEPGPACYGLGGNAATVTDADAVLGRIDPETFSGGRVALRLRDAGTALDAAIGRKLGLSTELAAFGVSEVVDTNMASAARIHAVESGKAFSDRTLIAFGGAAPLHAARVADMLGVRRIVIPASAGVGSCVGFLRAPMSFEIVRSAYQRLANFDWRQANQLIAALIAEARGIVKPAAGGAPLQEQPVAYMRYVGQGSEVVVALPVSFGADGRERLQERFEAAYRQQYGRTVPGSGIEIISFGVTVRAELDIPEAATSEPEAHAAEPVGRRTMFNHAQGRAIEVPYYRRERLRPGGSLVGPALIAEAQTSTVVGAGFRASIDRHGHLELVRQDGEEEVEA
jgi:N-methylhydantoinase A